MQTLLPLVVFLILLALVAPPLSLLGASVRYFRRTTPGERSALITVGIGFGVFALVNNGLFVMDRFESIWGGNLDPNGPLLFGLALSWFSFSGRIFLKSTLRHRRRMTQG